MELLRTFVALETPEIERKRFSAIQSRLKESDADVKWEPENKFHVTVKFLGDTDEGKLPKINSIIQSVSTSSAPFSLVFDSVGFFPNWQKPRVVWIGCSVHDNVASHIKTQLDKSLVPLGFEMENKPFHPHITLGRIKGENGLKHLLSIAENLTFEPSTILMNELILMKSVLRPEGSEYFILKNFSLGSPAQ
ncbi:MAG: RNA 2',3'-cyclic phosphodiesterase [Bacteroidota bacterium]